MDETVGQWQQLADIPESGLTSHGPSFLFSHLLQQCFVLIPWLNLILIPWIALFSQVDSASCCLENIYPLAHFLPKSSFICSDSHLSPLSEEPWEAISSPLALPFSLGLRIGKISFPLVKGDLEIEMRSSNTN